MKLILFCLLAAVAGFVVSKPTENVGDDIAENIWAVLIAGSNTWYNYRHQADVSHAYHVLINHGVPAEQIIVFMYDDIANNPANPYPGKIFNRPNGSDVYKGVKIDYNGFNVKSSTFFNALKGDVESNLGCGTGRVLKTKPTDNVFIYFSGHGAENIMGTPGDSDLITKIDLNETLYYMHENKMYKKLLFYLESCDSGSMFKGLSPELNIYAVTASNVSQLSWGVFCFNDPLIPGCFADEFSHNWMHNSDINNILIENIGVQVDSVVKNTKKSNVSEFGDLTLRNDLVSNFQGKEAHKKSVMESELDETQNLKINSRDVALLSVEQEMRNKKTSPELIEATMKKYYEKREELEHFFKKASKVFSSEKTMSPKSPVAELDCHEEAIKVFDKLCAPFHKNPYALKFSSNIANLCKFIPDSKPIISYFETHCKNGPRFIDVL